MAMARRHSRRLALAALLLPALLFRALIPVGFMPMIGEGGGLTLELCPGAAYSPVAVSAAEHAHHAHALHSTQHAGHAHDQHPQNGNSEQAPSSGNHHVPCLFAATAVSAPAPAILALSVEAVDPLGADHGEVARVFSPTIVRTQSPRAPPFLS